MDLLGKHYSTEINLKWQQFFNVDWQGIVQTGTWVLFTESLESLFITG